MDLISMFIMMVATGFFLCCITVIPLQQIFGFKDNSQTFNTLMTIFFTIGFFLPVIYNIIKSKHKSKYDYNKTNNNITKQTKTKKQKSNKPGLIYGLVSGLLSVSNDVYKETHGPKEYTEKELNDWDLTEEQKELVREGQYEPWNFEEDKKNLEEEDYYYEDDE